MLKENLSKLGFSPSEIKIYLHLAKTGSNYANKISSETNINRTNVYEALDRLISKGVVSFVTKNKVKWFEARNLKSILSLIKDKEEDLLNTKKLLINELSNISYSPKKSLEVNIFVGKKGLRMIFEEILDKKKPISLIAAELQFKELFGSYFELWHKQRIDRKIKQKSIFSRRFKAKLKNRELLEYKFVDSKFTNPTTTIIYGKTCVFIQWSKEPIAIKINNKGIIKSHLNYFNLIWNAPDSN
jgi:sugar-specific transcriptional regulator TrmB